MSSTSVNSKNYNVDGNSSNGVATSDSSLGEEIVFRGEVEPWDLLEPLPTEDFIVDVGYIELLENEKLSITLATEEMIVSFGKF